MLRHWQRAPWPGEGARASSLILSLGAEPLCVGRSGGRRPGQRGKGVLASGAVRRNPEQGKAGPENVGEGKLREGGFFKLMGSGKGFNG